MRLHVDLHQRNYNTVGKRAREMEVRRERERKGEREGGKQHMKNRMWQHLIHCINIFGKYDV